MAPIERDKRPVDFTVGDVERSIKMETTLTGLCKKFDVNIEQHAKTHRILEPQIQANTNFRLNSKAVYVWLASGGGLATIVFLGKIFNWY